MDWWEIAFICFDCAMNDSVGKLPLWSRFSNLFSLRPVPDRKQTVAERYNRGWKLCTFRDLGMSGVNRLSLSHTTLSRFVHSFSLGAFWARRIKGLLFSPLALSSPETKYFWSYRPCTWAQGRTEYFRDALRVISWFNFIFRETWM